MDGSSRTKLPTSRRSADQGQHSAGLSSAVGHCRLDESWKSSMDQRQRYERRWLFLWCSSWSAEQVRSCWLLVFCRASLFCWHLGRGWKMYIGSEPEAGDVSELSTASLPVKHPRIRWIALLSSSSLLCSMSMHLVGVQYSCAVLFSYAGSEPKALRWMMGASGPY